MSKKRKIKSGKVKPILNIGIGYYKDIHIIENSDITLMVNNVLLIPFLKISWGYIKIKIDD